MNRNACLNSPEYTMMKNSKLYGYKSGNGLITIPGNLITDVDAKVKFRSTQYGVFIDYKNIDSAPREINMLNSSVEFNGKKYDVDYRYGNEPIKWVSYSSGFHSTGVFEDSEGQDRSKLRFNPGQQLKGYVLIKIPGVVSITEKDLSQFAFNLDGFKADNFKKVFYYDLSKALLKD